MINLEEMVSHICVVWRIDLRKFVLRKHAELFSAVDETKRKREVRTQECLRLAALSPPVCASPGVSYARFWEEAICLLLK